MQYPVPQFIEREQRLLGPLTVRQTVILLVTGAILFVLYLILGNFFIFTIVAVIITAVALTLSFIEVNERPLVDFVFSFVNYFFQPRRYTWQKTETPPKPIYETPAPQGREGQQSQARKGGPEAVPPTGAPDQKKTQEIKSLADLLNE